jgi:hypothetical protein
MTAGSTTTYTEILYTRITSSLQSIVFVTSTTYDPASAKLVEIYRVLIEVDLSLAAVSVAAYSIAVPILGSRIPVLDAHIKRMKKALDRKIKGGKMRGVEQARREIRKWEEKKLMRKLFLQDLSLVSVVVIPGAAFAASAVASILGILVPSGLYVIFSILASAFGVTALVTSLYAAEKATKESIARLS